ncbi:hypothetical protein M514_14261 [Trichuris suis]|uniref:Uncharacterized protein n=1 Tax=Trichuris suis TaxID=68888 RepID=A0A085N9R6_9BILA|nr:hypothetical protein M514_14261 [Trichuris suis]
MYALLHCICDFLPSEMAARCSQQFYVDSYLDSFSNAKEAIAHCVALREATARGGFPLVKWASTRPEVLLSFPEGERSLTSLDLSPGTHQLEGVLGLLWDSREDAFRFAVTIPVGPVKTKRELFGSVARLYDPMGLLAPVVVKAKWMMRQATCESAGWDTVISEDIQRDYQR